MISTGSW